MSHTYWLHRISHEAGLSYQLLENGLLSIGFSKLAHAKAQAAQEQRVRLLNGPGFAATLLDAGISDIGDAL